ncbi:MAG: TlpA family protein disulfide reductase [Clostridiales Family XIII bacterium]|nr:TlpA family protein disulfide reductase [Clostridiales Family XIII bacterium]
MATEGRKRTIALLALAFTVALAFAACERNAAGDSGTGEDGSNGSPRFRNWIDAEQEDARSARNASNDSLSAGEASWLFAVRSIDLDGAAFSGASLKENRLTVVNFWATWCGPCVKELPALGRVANDYARRGVGIIGVLVDGVTETGKTDDGAIDAAKALLADADATYTSVLPDRAIGESYLGAVSSIPTTLIVDAGGNIVTEFLGNRNEEEWRKILDDALSE